MSESYGDADRHKKDKLVFKNIDGFDVQLQVVTHQPSLCEEYVVVSPKFNFRRWLIYTILLYSLSYSLQLHVQELWILFTLLIVISFALLLKIYFKVYKESLLIISAVGIQLTTTFLSGRRIVKFYNMVDVNSIIINEAITMHQVIYYLAVIMGQSESPLQQRLIPLFTNSYPRLACLTYIYQHANELLVSCNDDR